MKWILKVLKAAAGLYLVAGAAALVVSWSVKGGLRDPIRRFNRDTLNPWMLERAGGEHWYASVVKHVGRHSGAAYETPVVMHEVDGRLAIPLPYGREVDWLLNLEHSNRGAVVHKGVEYAVSDPELVTRTSIAEELGVRDALRYRAFGVDEFVALRAEPADAGPPTADEPEADALEEMFV
jgi:hypothetical protein